MSSEYKPTGHAEKCILDTHFNDGEVFLRVVNNIGSMQVNSLEPIPVELDVKSIEEEGGLAPYVAGYTSVETVQRLLIRLETTNGVVGWGETSTEPGTSVATAVINDVIAPEVVGRSVWEIEWLLDEFDYQYVPLDSFIGGVEMAMWDALGQELDAPLHQLLGGKIDSEVEFAYCVGILDPDESRIHARKAHEDGFNVLKTKGGLDMDADVERLSAMHDEVNGDLDFRLDANQTWSFEDAVRAIARLEDLGVYLQYIEQPLRIDNIGGYKRLRERLRTPIGVNEDMYHRHNLFQLVREDAIDVGVVDILPAGGIAALSRLAGVASDAGISLSHHSSFDLGIKTAAVLHTVSSTPAINLPPDTVYYSLADDVIDTPHQIEDGTISVPPESGLGINIDHSKVEQYRID